MSPMRYSKCPKTTTRRGISKGNPGLRGHGATYILDTATARFPRVSHTFANAASRTAKGDHLSRLTVRKGSHDVQCISGTSLWERDLRIHSRTGDGIT